MMNTVVDRLSNLPDKIAQVILSFLPGESLIRLSCVSKRYRKLCLQTSVLNFDDGFNLSADGFTLIPAFDSLTCLRRVQCINYFMNLRRLEGTQMKSFSLCWFYGDSNDVSFVNKLLFQALHSGVQEISLVTVPRLGFDSHMLPFSILISKTLKKLTLNLKNSRILLPLSCGPCLNFLEYLKIESADLDDRRDIKVGELFSRSSKFLKELFLVDCARAQQLSITSSSLLVFHLHYRKHHRKHRRQNHRQLPRLKISASNLQELDIVWFPPFSTDDPSSFEIDTPKLQVFNWMGNPVRSFSCLTTLSHLERAALNLTEFPPNNSEYDVHEVVCSIENVTCLQPLHMRSIAVLAGGNGIPFMFHYLKSLVIASSSLTANEAAPLRSLLMGTPNLRELSITSHGLSPYFGPCSSSNAESSELVAASYDSEFWESGLLFLGQLKSLTIELYEGPFMIELFRFLLKNAQVLQNVTVYYSPPSFPQEVAAIIAEFKQDFTVITIRVV